MKAYPRSPDCCLWCRADGHYLEYDPRSNTFKCICCGKVIAAEKKMNAHDR